MFYSSELLCAKGALGQIWVRYVARERRVWERGMTDARARFIRVLDPRESALKGG